MSILRSLPSFVIPPEFLALIFDEDYKAKAVICSYLKDPFALSCFFEELLKKVLGTDWSFFADVWITKEAAFAMLVMAGFFLCIMKFCTLRVCRPIEDELPKTKVLFLMFLDGLGGKFKTLLATAL